MCLLFHSLIVCVDKKMECESSRVRERCSVALKGPSSQPKTGTWLPEDFEIAAYDRTHFV